MVVSKPDVDMSICCGGGSGGECMLTHLGRGGGGGGEGCIDRTGICLGTDMTISAYYFGILKLLCTHFEVYN